MIVFSAMPEIALVQMYIVCLSQPAPHELKPVCLLQVLAPIVHSNLQSRSLQKPILVITITDGGSVQKDFC